jgi:hypothetical protein
MFKAFKINNILRIGICALLCLALSACDSSDNKSSQDSNDETPPVSNETNNDTASESDEENDAATDSSNEDEDTTQDSDISQNPSTDGNDTTQDTNQDGDDTATPPSEDDNTDTPEETPDSNEDEVTTPEPVGIAPRIALTSPRFNSATTSSVFAVRGSTSDVDSTVSEVIVNNVQAESDDNFDTWLALLPLGSSIENLVVSAKDSQGNKTVQSYNVKINKLGSVFSEPTELSLDEQSGQLIITDKSQGTLYKSSLSNPMPTPIELNLDGNQHQLKSPQKTILGKSLNNALLIDETVSSRSATNSIYSINTSTGSTVAKAKLGDISGIANVIDIATSNNDEILYILSELENSRSRGAIVTHNLNDSTTETLITTEAHSHPDATAPSNLTINEIGDTLYYLDNDALISVEISTSTITTVSRRGGSIELQNPRDLIIDSTLNKAWISDIDQQAIIEVNMFTGSRRIVSNSTIGDGPLLQSPDKLVLDRLNSRILVTDREYGFVLSVELANGEREYYINNRYGYGPDLEEPSDIAIDIENNLAYVSDNTAKAIFSINLNNGYREAVSENNGQINQGENIQDLAQLSLDTSSQTLWASDKGLGKVLSIDLTSGQRSPLTLSYQPGSQVVQKPTGISYDANDHTLLVSDIFNDSVQAIELSDSSVHMKGSKTLSNGNKIDKPISVSHNSLNDKIYALDALQKAIIEWDLANGTSRVLSKLFTGQGISFSKPIDIQIDSNAMKAYVSDADLNAIFIVDLTSGDRNILSSNSIGSGPLFKSVSGIALNTSNNTLLVADPESNAIFSILLSDGSRSVLSR